MTTFFTSDEHLGHKNIIKFCNRPFADVDEMATKLLANHNAVVGKDDHVYHLGDMFWRTFGIVPAMDYVQQLNGHHYRIRGNHEELFEKWGELRSLFHWTQDIAEVKLDGYPRVILCHYALREWHCRHKGSWHLYGHSHGVLVEDFSLSFDVGVDATDYRPLSIDQIAARMYRKMEVCLKGEERNEKAGV